jgi:hypothetical protein
MTKQPASSTQLLLTQVCRYAAGLHLLTAGSGMLVVAGVVLLDLLGADYAYLETLGILLGTLFGLALVSGVPMAGLVFLFCRTNRPLVVQSALLLVLFSVLWFFRGLSMVTELFLAAIFLFYAVTVFYFYWHGRSEEQARD